MKILTICPSTFMDGYDTYSPAATKVLFDSRQVSHIFPGLSPEDDSNTSDEPIQNSSRCCYCVGDPAVTIVTIG